MEWKDALLDIIKDSGDTQKIPKQYAENTQAKTPQATTLRFGEPLSKHTYFGIGGEATAYIEISTVSQLAEVARFHRQWDVPVAIIGRGSNLLVSDTGFNGIGVRLVGGVSETGGRWEGRFGRRGAFIAATFQNDGTTRTERCGIRARYPRFRRRGTDYERWGMGE